MKLRINKFTLSCVAVLSSAILFGVNGINVHAADSGTGNNTSAVSSSTTKDEDKPIDGGSYDGFTPAWAIYAINGNENNLQLRLGNPEETEGIDDTTGWGNLEWMGQAKGFSDRITSEVIVGKIKASPTQQFLFSAMPNLKTITGLNLLDTSDTTNFSNMFSGDTSLESVDISSWDMSKVKADGTVNMFEKTSLSSLTLGPKSVISNSDLSPEPFTYTVVGNKHTANGWRDSSDTSADPKVVLTKDLMSMYSLGSTKRTQTTWVPNRVPENIKYYVQYVDSSTGEDLPVKSDQTYDGVTDNKPVDLATITNGKLTLAQIGQVKPGYSADTVENKTSIIDDDGNGGYSVKAEIKKLDPVNISVSQTVGTDKSTDASFKIPVNDASYKYANITAPANSTINLNKSTIKIGDGTAESFASYSPTSKDLNSVLSEAITSQLKNGVFGDKTAGTTPITVNAVYIKKSTGGGSSSGNHHNSNEDNNIEDKGGTTNSVSQTVSTTTKDVSLYDNKGKLITDRALGKDSGWFSDQEYTLDGTLYYRVASNEYVKASDVYVYTAQNNIVRVQGKSIVYMVDSVGHKVTDRALSPDTEWYSDRYTIINGQKYYRVATNEFVSAADVSLL